MTNRTKNQRGSTLIEAALVMAAMTGVLAVGFFLISLSFAQVWSHFALYEALICAAEENPPRHCETQARRRLEVFFGTFRPKVVLALSHHSQYWQKRAGFNTPSAKLRGTVTLNLRGQRPWTYHLELAVPKPQNSFRETRMAL